MADVIDVEPNNDHDAQNAENIPKTIILNSNKAGLQNLDREKINKTIEEASKGSNFYSFQQKRQRRIDHQIHQLKSQLEKITQTEFTNSLKKADVMIQELEVERILNKIIVHFDMDMFFAAVELKDKPELIDKPMAVGTMSMIATSNYVARKFGVCSAMAGFIAKKLCPELVLVAPNYKKYSHESELVMKIIAEFDSNLKCFSLDEVYIDLTDYVLNECSTRLQMDLVQLYTLSEFSDDVWDCAYDVVTKIRQKVLDETKLSISAGISCNYCIAKVCTDINKPNGQFMVKGHKQDLLNFASNIEMKKFSGVGPVKKQILASLGIITGRDLIEKRDVIFALFPDHHAISYLKLALGIGHSFASTEIEAQKSHSCERTVSDLNDQKTMLNHLEELSHRVSRDLKKNSQLCKTVTLKLKKSTFEVFLKSRSTDTFTDDERIIYKIVKALLLQELQKAPKTLYRLIGVKVSNLTEIEESSVPGVSNQATLSQIIKKMPQTNKRKVESNEFECDINPEDFFVKSENQMFSDENLVCDSSEPNNSLVLVHDPVEAGQVSDDPIEPPLYLSCPICKLTTVFKDNAELNSHIDLCLNKDVCIELTQVAPSTSSSAHKSSLNSSKTNKPSSHSNASSTKNTNVNNKKVKKNDSVDSGNCSILKYLQH